MALVRFTENIQRHVACPSLEVDGRTVRDVLEAVFATNEPARGYVLDERGQLRKHMAVFVNGRLIGDRTQLSDLVPEGANVDVLQALSGG